MDDKKKIIAVGALFFAMLAIGAFQLTKGGDDTPAKPADSKAAGSTGTGGSTKITDTKAGDKKDEKAKNPLVSLPLEARDPFKPVSLPNAAPAPSTTPSPKPVAPPPRENHRPTRLAPIPPVQVEGAPMPGQLPPANATGLNGPLSGPLGAPSGGGAPVSTFGYQLKGTLMGDRPMAVFADSQGNERIVPVGSSLDGDSQVVSVAAGAVKVRVHGKTLTMTPGGKE